MTTPPDVTFTFQDWLQTPEDGLRHEVLEGDHVVTPSPILTHQSISVRILYQFCGQIELTGRGRVFHAPAGVRLSNEDVVEPDLVVELLSKSKGRRDRGISRRSRASGPPGASMT